MNPNGTMRKKSAAITRSQTVSKVKLRAPTAAGVANSTVTVVHDANANPPSMITCSRRPESNSCDI